MCPVHHAYSRNGLNQYASVGRNAYTYDIENRLVSTGATLSYDQLGRLAQTYSPTAGTTRRA